MKIIKSLENSGLLLKVSESIQEESKKKALLNQIINNNLKSPV